MIKREPHPDTIKTYTPSVDDKGRTLGQQIDKGFPYDDGDVDINERMTKVVKKPGQGTIVGKLNE